MTTKAMISFDHLPKSLQTWTTYADHDMTFNAGNCIIDANGWLTGLVGTQNQQMTTIPLAKHLVAPVAKIWCGIRLRIEQAATSSRFVIWDGANTILLFSDLVQGAGAISYFEFSYTVATGVCERRMNGKPMADVKISVNNRALNFIIDSKGSSPNSYIAYRDIYVNDDQGGVTGFLGSSIVGPVTFDVVTGTDWTTNPTGNTLADAINGAGTVPTAITAVSGASKANLVASMKPNLPAGVTATAIEITVGLASSVAAVVNCSTKLKSGASETAGNTVQGRASNAYSYSNPAGVFPKSPTGEAWTNATIDVTDFVLTPDV